MPSRIVDGEALWRSDKLKKVKPSSFRAEYANLLPLALADGSFECNVDRIFFDVYAYNRPDISKNKIKKILNEFQRVGLLQKKTDAEGREWGYWVGIESRLPSDSTRHRYKIGKADLFVNIINKSRYSHDEVMNGLDGFGIGKDRIGEQSRQPREETPEINFKIIGTRWSSFFKTTLSHSIKNKEQYSKACSQFGEDWVLDQFDQWAPQNMWLVSNPKGGGCLYKFLEVLSEIKEGGELAVKREKDKKENNKNWTLTPEQLAELNNSLVQKDIENEENKKLEKEYINANINQVLG